MQSTPSDMVCRVEKKRKEKKRKEKKRKEKKRKEKKRKEKKRKEKKRKGKEKKVKEKEKRKWFVCRVHAKNIGHSLFGDDAYGGAGGSAVSAVGRGKSLRYARHKQHQCSKAISMSCLISE